jgi:hypothetical protein
MALGHTMTMTSLLKSDGTSWHVMARHVSRIFTGRAVLVLALEPLGPPCVMELP